MAISAATTWEVRPTNGVDTNGGGFVRGAAGTDFSQQNAKNTAGNNISTTDVVTTGVATITSASASFTSAIVGNIIYLVGTGITTGWYQVVTFTNSTTVILDRSPGTGTLGTMNIGGALKTITQLNTNMTTGHVAWIKAEATISVTAAFTWSFSSNAVFSFVAGYTTTRGDAGQVTLQATSGTNYIIMTIGNNGGNQTTSFKNFILDCNNKVGVSGLTMQGGGTVADNIIVKNEAGGTAFNINNNGATCGTLRNCLVTASDNVVGFDNHSANLQTLLYRCAVIGCTSVAGATTPFNIVEGNVIECISANNSGAAADGFLMPSSGRAVLFQSCIAYNNGRDGIRFPVSLPTYPILIENCIIVNNAGVGINNPGATIPAGAASFDFNAFFGNGSVSTGLTVGANCVTLSGDPFVAGASNNFALNTTAGAGAACRAAGFPGVLPLGGTGYKDIGALQHQDSAVAAIVHLINKNINVYVDVEP